MNQQQLTGEWTVRIKEKEPEEVGKAFRLQCRSTSCEREEMDKDCIVTVLDVA